MATKRSDVHSPTNLVCEDYECKLVADNEAPWVLLTGDYGLELSRRLGRTDRLERGTWQCHHCGAHLRYFALLEHLPTGDLIAVGETCLDNRFERATVDFQALRKQAELDRGAKRIRKLVAAFVEANPDLAWAGTREVPETSVGNGFVQDIVRKLNQYGELSERQVTALRTAVERDAARAAEKAAEVETLTAVVEGRQVVTGEVLSTKWVEGDWGSTQKFLVLDDRSFKVWCTVPAAISVERGDRVSFTCTVECGRDFGFGFGKRPSKASVIATAAVAS